MLTVYPTFKMFHEFSTVLSTYDWRRGVTDHSGHLTNGYALMNVCRTDTRMSFDELIDAELEAEEDQSIESLLSEEIENVEEAMR